MQKPEASGYLRHIVLLTDGDLGNEEEIFAALRLKLGGARLYTVAIGSAPNFFLASKMAQFGRAPSRISRISARFANRCAAFSKPLRVRCSLM